MAKVNSSIFDEMDLNPLAVPNDQLIQQYYEKFRRNPNYHKVPRVKEEYYEEDEETGKQVKKTRSVAYKNFTKREIDRLLKFIILFIDTQSPYAEYRDFNVRMKKCLKALRFHDDGAIKEEIEEAGDLYQNLVFEFFKEINAHQYEAWFSMKMNLHQMNHYLRSKPQPDRNGNIGPDINARRQLSNTIPNLLAELVEMEYNIFPDARLEKIINDKAVEESIGGYAEKYALSPKYNK